MKLGFLGEIQDVLMLLSASYNASESELESIADFISNIDNVPSNFGAHRLDFDDCLKVYSPVAWEAYLESEEHSLIVNDAVETSSHIDLEGILHERIHNEYHLNKTAFFAGGKEINILIVTDIAYSTKFYYKIEY